MKIINASKLKYYMVWKLCACIPLVTYCIKCRINSFKCGLLVVMHGPPTAVKYVGPASFRSLAHTHIHTMIRSVIPLTGVNIQLICNDTDALVSFWKKFKRCDKNIWLYKKQVITLSISILITGILKTILQNKIFDSFQNLL